MTQSRVLTTALVFVLLISGIGAATMAISASYPNMQISSVAITPDEPKTGESITVETTISNLESSSDPGEITAIYVRSSTGGLNEHGRIRDIGMVDPGGDITVPMSVTFDEPGEKRLTVHVGVRGVNRSHQTYRYPLSIDVTDPAVRADLTSNISTDQTDTTGIELTNFGNTDLSDVEITATTNGEVIDRRFMLDVAPGSSQFTTFDTELVSANTVNFTANYTAAGSDHTISRRVDLTEETPVEGEIRLTGTETTRTGTGTGITIEGEAANTGSTDTESVLVRLPNSEGVTPVSPSGEYFVGAVEASEFARFELTGEVESETSSVPIEITYIVDGERVTTTEQFDIASANSSAPSEPDQQAGEQSSTDGQSNGLPTVPLLLALVLVVVGLGIVRWRSQ